MIGRDREQPDLGAELFSFVVVADTHMNQEEARSSSPYLCNKLANARSRHVLHEINALAPAFVIHLGDLINPVPALPSYAPAAANFHALARELQAPLHIAPGNHDIGDKPVAWMPAGNVNDDYVALYEQHFGRHYYAFDGNGLRFLIINAPIMNSGLACEAEQKAWLERELAASAGHRTFLCIHYPPYVSNPDEAGNYDNIDEPARSWLLALIARHKPEALFAGHVHNFWYDRYGETDCYILPSTAFVRHDYSEMYKIEPGAEFGRDDAAKLGYFIVRVYERGHVAHMVRSYGTTLAPGAVSPPRKPQLRRLHSQENRRGSVCVDLRHPWAETVEIAPSGALDEFERKFARNDYPLLALWEMGVRKLRVPIQDLTRPATRRRMALLKRLGHVFTVYQYGVPQGSVRELLVEHRALVDVLEIILLWKDVSPQLADIAVLRDAVGAPVSLSKLRTHEDAKYDGSRFNHFINHGFVVAERDQLEGLRADPASRGAIDGLVFRIPRETSPWDGVGAIRSLSAELGFRSIAHVRMAGGNPAEAFMDDTANAARVAEATMAALADPASDVVLDTFLDADRGYYARTGLIDRRCNPRPASHMVRHLHEAFANLPALLTACPPRSVDGVRQCRLEDRAGAMVAWLALPERDGATIVLSDAGQVIDLLTGVIDARRAGAVVVIDRPTLIRAGA
ncbi:MAG: metallophosphoesterase [Pseudomonadota bacterium]